MGQMGQTDTIGCQDRIFFRMHCELICMFREILRSVFAYYITVMPSSVLFSLNITYDNRR